MLVLVFAWQLSSFLQLLCAVVVFVVVDGGGGVGIISEGRLLPIDRWVCAFDRWLCVFLLVLVSTSDLKAVLLPTRHCCYH